MSLTPVLCAVCNNTIRKTKSQCINGTWIHKGCVSNYLKQREKYIKVFACYVCGKPSSAKRGRPCNECLNKAHQRVRELNGQKKKHKRRVVGSSSGYWSKDGSRYIAQTNTGKSPTDTQLHIPPIKVYSGGLCTPK